MDMWQLRTRYHREICHKILGQSAGIPNLADPASTASIALATALAEALGYPLRERLTDGQALRRSFIQTTLAFLEDSFSLVRHLSSRKWTVSAQSKIDVVLNLEQAVTPDIVISRSTVTSHQINASGVVLPPGRGVATLTPSLRTNRAGAAADVVASICCKWAIKPFAAYLNLSSALVGKTPHIVAVVAEPLPTRIASLALGTGDIDCVYHIALPELVKATRGGGHADQADMLDTLIDGRRLRDIADLPLDLAI